MFDGDSSNRAIISDIAVNNVETLYKKGTKTISALSDLVEVIQAAVLNETVIASPIAYKNSTLLQSMKSCTRISCNVTKYDDKNRISSIHETTLSEGLLSAGITDSEKEGIEVFADENENLKSNSPFGDLILAMSFGELMQFDKNFWGLFNPNQLDENIDQGACFLKKFPFMMIMLQITKGVAPFDDEELVASVSSQITPSLSSYTKYVSQMLRIQEETSSTFINSSLEAPLIDCLQISSLTDNIENDEIFSEVVEKIKNKIIEIPQRKEHLEYWRMPPLGMMVLGNSKSLDDIPYKIEEARDMFSKLRKSTQEYTNKLILAKNAGESGSRDADHYRQELRAAYEAFDDKVQASRRSPILKRQELIFDLTKYVNWFCSFGIGIIKDATEYFKIKREANLGLIPGFSKAASFIKGTDGVIFEKKVKEFLGKEISNVRLQKEILSIGIDQSQLYSSQFDGASIHEELVIEYSYDDDEDSVKIPCSTLWLNMLNDEDVSDILLQIGSPLV